MAVQQQQDTRERVLALIDAMLGEGGLASEAGYHYAEQQHDYARRTGLILCGYDAETAKASIGMLEAATGLGKTLGYLVALLSYAAVSGERCAISTHSRQLQRQMQARDAVKVLEWVKSLTGVSLTLARRVGRLNYASGEKIQSLLKAIPAGRDAEAKAHFSRIHDFLVQLRDWLPDGSGVLDDFLEERGLDVPDGLGRRQITLDQQGSEQDAAQYRADIAATNNADVVIINHALLVLHAYRWGAILDDREDGGRIMRAVVVDEAHKLPAIAEQVLSESLSLVRMAQVCRSVSEQLGEGEKDWAAVSERCEVLRQFLQDKHESHGGRYASARNIEGLGKHLRGLADDAKRAGLQLEVQLSEEMIRGGVLSSERRNLYAEAMDHRLDAMRLAHAMDKPDAGTPIVSWSPVKEYPSLAIGAPAAGRTLSRLWAPLAQEDKQAPPRPALNAIMLTSATLGAPGDPLPKAFDSISRELGIIRHAGKDGTPVHNVQVDLMARFMPAVFGAMTFVLPDPGVPSPSRKTYRAGVLRIDTHPEWLAFSADMLAAAAGKGERVLALTLSWRDTRALAVKLTDIAPDLNIIEHQRGVPLKSALSHFEQEDDAILITPAGWEGVDSPGMVKNLFLHRIPFPPPDTDATFRLRLHLRDQGYGTDAATRIINQQNQESVRQTLAQGLGRGIRAADDTCCVWMADPRFPIPADWRDSFDPEMDERMDSIQARRYNRRLLEAIPTRFRRDYDEAEVFLADKRLYRPEDI